VAKKVDFIVEYLCEYEAICKKSLTRVSGAQIEKNRGRKSHDRVPLIIQEVFKNFEAWLARPALKG
jgi:hypothetical protein